jgi:hypothetical protein
MYFRARFRSEKKLENFFWTDTNLKISPKEDFSQKRPISPNQLHQNVYFDLKIYIKDLNRALKYMHQ